MNISQTFVEFIDNLKVVRQTDISNKYKKITKALNKEFYDSKSEISHSLQVGSYGRGTAIKGVSDLDMIYEMPPEAYSTYNSRVHGQSDLLQEVRNALLEPYPNTKIRGDGQVVVISFTGFQVEVCPSFLQEDNSYIYPDSNKGGKWRKTDPRPEITEMRSFNYTTNGNLKHLAKMCRSWKNNVGVKMGGLLIDTLCYKFLKENEDHWETTYKDYHTLVLDFFTYLSNTDKDQKSWLAPGSNQKAYKKANFIPKAKKAVKNITEAINKNENATVYSIWKRVFGMPFPYPKEILEKTANYTLQEQFIEELFPIDIINSLLIDCVVTQDGFQNRFLSKIIKDNSFLSIDKKLKFEILHTDVEKPYSVKWKIKNKGEIAKLRNSLRGNIIDDSGLEKRIEHSNFSGNHFVECYVIKEEICVARARIDVPIYNN